MPITVPPRSYAGTTRPGLVLLAGPLYDFPIDPKKWAFIAAADGGARHALEQRVLPDYVVGDFDSLSKEHEQQLLDGTVAVQRLPREKDLTDGEAVLTWALEQRATDTIVLAGGLGGRFDHELSVVLLLATLDEAGLTGFVTDGRQRVFLLRGQPSSNHPGNVSPSGDRRTTTGDKSYLKIEGDSGDQLSVIPLTAEVTGLSISGVHWPLDEATLPMTTTLGLSNQLTSQEARLSVRTGTAVVVHTPAAYA